MANAIGFPNTYPLDSDLSGNLRSGVILFHFIFASLLLWLEREKNKIDYRDKGRGHDRRLFIRWIALSNA